MSKIYDALQIAHGERLATSKTQYDVPTVSLPALLKPDRPYSHPTAKLYQDSELLVLAQNIAAVLPHPEKNVIQFIGSREGEGTSTLIREFAINSAQLSSKPVLLVEADHLRPCQFRAFNIQPKTPLDKVLEKESVLDGAVSRIEQSNLFLATLSSGGQSSLTRRSFFGPTDMWKAVKDRFSLILIDSSPVTVSTDSLAICETVDGIVFVVEAEKTRSVVAMNVKNQILMHEGNLLGIVFTKRKFYIPEFFYKLM